MRISTCIVLISGFLLLVSSCATPKSEKESKTRADNLEPIPSQSNSALASDLDSLYAMNQLSGFALAVFTSDSILYENAYGFQNIELKEKYTLSTVQIIASITKSFVGVSLLQAVDDGILNLDDEVNSYIDFDLVNPHYPNTPITLRQLASHTSSISDSNTTDEGYRFEYPLNPNDFPEAYAELIPRHNQTEQFSLSEFLEQKLSAQGKWYEESSFMNSSPGTNYEYSNYGVALLAHAIERARERPFNEVIEEDILMPLGMVHSTWDAKETNEALRAVLYNELFNRVPKYTLITYPDGGLCSSVTELTLFLQEIMKCYQGKGTLLSETSCKSMLTRHYPCEDCEDGICWDLSFTGLMGHGGNDFGTATLMYFDPEKDIGRILFTNTSVETERQENEFYGIFNALFKYEY